MQFINVNPKCASRCHLYLNSLLSAFADVRASRQIHFSPDSPCACLPESHSYLHHTLLAGTSLLEVMPAPEPTRTIMPGKPFVSTGQQAQARLMGTSEPPQGRDDLVTLKVTREELQILLDSVAFVKTHCGDLEAFYEHVKDTEGVRRFCCTAFVDWSRLQDDPCA